MTKLQNPLQVEAIHFIFPCRNVRRGRMVYGQSAAKARKLGLSSSMLTTASHVQWQGIHASVCVVTPSGFWGELLELLRPYREATHMRLADFDTMLEGMEKIRQAADSVTSVWSDEEA